MRHKKLKKNIMNIALLISFSFFSSLFCMQQQPAFKSNLEGEIELSPPLEIDMQWLQPKLDTHKKKKSELVLIHFRRIKNEKLEWVTREWPDIANLLNCTPTWLKHISQNEWEAVKK